MDRPAPVQPGGATALWLEWERAGTRSRRPLDRPLTIGRDPGSSICLDEATVSRHHAVVTLVAGQPFVDASTSTNGIELDRGRANRVALGLGQTFRIGSATFRVVAGPPAKAPESPSSADVPVRRGPSAPIAAKGAGGARALPTSRRHTPAPVLLVAAIAVVLVAGTGLILASRLLPGSVAPSNARGNGSAYADLPAFPVPAGSTLLSDSAQVSSAGGNRLASWNSGSDYGGTTKFYSSLADARWKAAGAATTTPRATDFSLDDASGVYSGAEVQISRTDPVRISVTFESKAGTAGQTQAPGPTVALRPLPVATSLPGGFPPEFVPRGAKLVDASSLDSTYFAVFSGGVDLTSYEDQIAQVAQVGNTHSESGATVIEFTYDGQPGQVEVDTAAGEVTVEVTR